MAEDGAYSPEEEKRFAEAFARLRRSYGAFNMAFPNLSGSGLEDLSKRELVLAINRYESQVPEDVRNRKEIRTALEEIKSSTQMGRSSDEK